MSPCGSRSAKLSRRPASAPKPRIATCSLVDVGPQRNGDVFVGGFCAWMYARATFFWFMSSSSQMRSNFASELPKYVQGLISHM